MTVEELLIHSHLQTSDSEILCNIQDRTCNDDHISVVRDGERPTCPLCLERAEEVIKFFANLGKENEK